MHHTGKPGCVVVLIGMHPTEGAWVGTPTGRHNTGGAAGGAYAPHRWGWAGAAYVIITRAAANTTCVTGRAVEAERRVHPARKFSGLACSCSFTNYTNQCQFLVWHLLRSVSLRQNLLSRLLHPLLLLLLLLLLFLLLLPMSPPYPVRHSYMHWLLSPG